MVVNDDPFGWLMEDCHITSSQESDFQHCSYFGSSDPIDSNTGHPYPPESSEHEIPNDGTEIVPHDMDSGTIVDLGRDTDLVFSEVELNPTQEIEAESNQDDTFRMESEEDRVSKRELSNESCSERLDLESPSVRLGSPEKSDNVALMKSSKNLTLSPGGTLVPELQNQQNHESNFEVFEASVNGEPEATVSEKNRKFTILDLLRQLAKEDSEEDRELCCLSLLEVAERRWGKF